MDGNIHYVAVGDKDEGQAISTGGQQIFLLVEPPMLHSDAQQSPSISNQGAAEPSTQLMPHQIERTAEEKDDLVENTVTIKRTENKESSPPESVPNLASDTAEECPKEQIPQPFVRETRRRVSLRVSEGGQKKISSNGETFMNNMQNADEMKNQDKISEEVKVKVGNPRHSQILLQNVRNLQQNQKLVDITLTCQGQSINAHRLVLASFSTLLHTILTDTDGDYCSILSLDHLGVDAQCLSKLIDFMYTGYIDKDNVSLDALLEAAKTLSITTAIDEVECLKNSVESTLNVKLEPLDVSICATSKVASETANPKRKRGRPRKSSPPAKVRITETDIVPENTPAVSSPRTRSSKQKEVKKEPEDTIGTGKGEKVEAADLDFFGQDYSPDVSDGDDNDEKDAEKDPDFTDSNLKTYSRVTRYKGKKRVLVRIKNSKGRKIQKTAGTYILLNTGHKPDQTDEGKAETSLKKRQSGDQLVARAKKISKYRTMKKSDGLYHCSEPNCGFNTKSDQNMARHLVTQHCEDRPFKCAFCEKAFKLKKYMVEHERTHTDERPYECEVCGVKFRAAKHRNRHRRIHTGEKSFTCELCGKSFAAQFTLSQHTKSVHDGIKPFKCDVPGCEYASLTSSAVKVHKNTKHSENRERILCDICGRAFKTRQSLQVHTLAVHEEATFKCPHCPYTSSFKTGINSHVKRRHGVTLDGKIASPRYQCDQCEFSCFTKHEFQRHNLNHRGEKPFKCPVCDYATVEKMNLKFHMRMHTGEKPHECKICHRKFPRTLGLKRHMLCHTGDKPHKCTECGMAYADKKSLETHCYSQHLHIKPYKCDMCSYACIKRENLTSHVRKVHNVGPNTRIRIMPLKNVILPASSSMSSMATHYTTKLEEPEGDKHQTVVDVPEEEGVAVTTEPVTTQHLVQVEPTQFQQVYADHFQAETITVYGTIADTGLEMIPTIQVVTQPK